MDIKELNKIEYNNGCFTFQDQDYDESNIPKTELYKLMKSETERYNMPQNYQTDFTLHDKFNLFHYKPRN